MIADLESFEIVSKYLTGPDVDPEDADRTVTGQTEACTELLYLEQIGAYGVVVKKVAEGSPEFIPWGAVLAILDVRPSESDDAV
jgi:hypothetical protein